MITKEKLKELIEQEATVYDPDTLWQSVGEVKLNKGMKINNGRLDGDLGDLGLKGAMCSCYIPLEDLFENKEDAEFIVKYHTQRPEYFEPPTWEEFVEMEEWCFFQKNHKQTIIRVLGTKYLGVETNFERYFTGDLSKENYYKAVEKARKLFLGESDVKD